MMNGEVVAEAKIVNQYMMAVMREMPMTVQEILVVLESNDDWQ